MKNPFDIYAGQRQPTKIKVPARIAYKYLDWEEGPWAMPPYSLIFGGEPVVFPAPGRAKPAKPKAKRTLTRGDLMPVVPWRMTERPQIPLQSVVYCAREPKRIQNHERRTTLYRPAAEPDHYGFRTTTLGGWPQRDAA